MHRTLTRTGTSTTLALPAKWVREHDLEPGKEVSVQTSPGRIVIEVAPGHPEKIRIPYDAPLIKELLTKLYSENFSRITIDDAPEGITGLVDLFPGFTITEQSAKRVIIDRTLKAAGHDPRPVLRRALRLMEEAFTSNPPNTLRTAEELLFLLTLEQYRPQLVRVLREIITVLPTTAPYYDNAYAHFADTFSLLAKQQFSFTVQRAKRIADALTRIEEIEQKGFSRTKNPQQLSRLLHATRLLSHWHELVLAQQSVDVLQKARRRTVQKPYTVGVCLVNSSNPFWEVDVKGGIVKEAESTDIGLLIDAPVADSDAKAQAKILKTMLDKGVDALIHCPVDSKENEDVLLEFKRRNIPVIAVDTDIDLSVNHHYVGFDNYKGGRMVARFLNDMIDEESHVLVLEGRPNGNSPDRCRGFTETLRTDHIHSIQADYVRSIAYEKTLEFLGEHDVDAIFAASDNMAHAAIQALKAADKQAIVCGFDYTEEGRTAMQQGFQACDVDTKPRKMGVLAMQLADALVHGKEAPRQVIYDIELKRAEE